MNGKLTLEEASEELSTITPEKYIELLDYIASLEVANAKGLPEAPASINFRVKTAEGPEAMFTMRDWDENALLERFGNVVALMKEHGAEPVKRGRGNADEEAVEVRITSEVDPSVIEGENVERFEVSSLTYQFAGKTPYLLVRGGFWTKYGWRAYPEIIPPSIPYGDWTQGEERNSIPADLRYAFVDKTKKKIMAFATA